MNILEGKLPNASNYKKGRTACIKYIVIHYTANKGDIALNNVKYFANNVVKASAHFFVDEKYIYTSVPVTDTAWHCGGGRQSNTGGQWYGKCMNSNSIGIEMCLWDKKGNIKYKTVENTIELTKYLMEKYDIPAENVIRHWDVTGKICPAPYTGDNNTYWMDFKKRITNTVKPSDNNTEEEVYAMIYNTIDEIPEFAKPTIQKLCDKGYIKGSGKGLDLTYDMVRILVILDRAGVFE